MMRMRWRETFIGALFWLVALSCQGDPGDQDHTGHAASDHSAHSAHSGDMNSGSGDLGFMKPGDRVGVDEKQGMSIPLETVFLDENHTPRKLGDLIDKPTLLLPVYYSCPTVCNIMLGNLASALNDVPLKPGKDFGILAFGFDEMETPALAHSAKQNYIRILKPGFPESAWKFLTGKKEDIKAVTDALGYRFARTGEFMFVHPNVLIVLAKDGKIIRYLYGPDFLPFDIGMALSEAIEGNPALSVRKLMTYCFDYDPANRRYVFKTFRVVGTAILVSALAFFLLVLRKKKT